MNLKSSVSHFQMMFFEDTDFKKGKNNNIMKWVKVKKKLPIKNQIVLVYGKCNGEISGLAEDKSIGLVMFNTIEISGCVDQDYYSMYYSHITHWCEVPTEPK